MSVALTNLLSKLARKHFFPHSFYALRKEMAAVAAAPGLRDELANLWLDVQE
jgi:hypothetical protein